MLQTQTKKFQTSSSQTPVSQTVSFSSTFLTAPPDALAWTLADSSEALRLSKAESWHTQKTVARNCVPQTWKDTAHSSSLLNTKNVTKIAKKTNCSQVAIKKALLTAIVLGGLLFEQLWAASQPVSDLSLRSQNLQATPPLATPILDLSRWYMPFDQFPLHPQNSPKTADANLESRGLQCWRQGFSWTGIHRSSVCFESAVQSFTSEGITRPILSSISLCSADSAQHQSLRSEPLELQFDGRSIVVVVEPCWYKCLTQRWSAKNKRLTRPSFHFFPFLRFLSSLQLHSEGWQCGCIQLSHSAICSTLPLRRHAEFASFQDLPDTTELRTGSGLAESVERGIRGKQSHCPKTLPYCLSNNVCPMCMRTLKSSSGNFLLTCDKLRLPLLVIGNNFLLWGQDHHLVGSEVSGPVRLRNVLEFLLVKERRADPYCQKMANL